MPLFYFSGTGNTKWAAEVLAEYLQKLGMQTDLHSIESLETADREKLAEILAASEHVILGYPTYGSGMPRIVRNFISRLPETVGGKRLSVFCTHACFTGDGNVYFRKALSLKGYHMACSFQIALTTNFNVAILPFSLFRPHSGAKLEKRKQKARARLAKMAKAIRYDKTHIDGTLPHQIILGSFQRCLFRMAEHSLPEKFYFIKQRCISCGACVKNCPAQNWSFDSDGELKSAGTCFLCFRCYNSCPTLAINFGKKTDPEKFIRYKGPDGKDSDFLRSQQGLASKYCDQRENGSGTGHRRTDDG